MRAVRSVSWVRVAPSRGEPRAMRYSRPGEATGLTTNRRDGGDIGERGRPSMRSSHEKVKVARGPRRGAAAGTASRGRAAVSARAESKAPLRERPRPPKRVRVAEAPVPGAVSVASESARDTAATIAMAAIEKKAIALEILDVAGRVDYADFLVIMTGRSDRHAQSLTQGIEDALRKKGVRPTAIEGLQQGSWVLMDFGDVVVHVFQDDARQLYDIDGLWLDARRLPVPGEEARPEDRVLE
jgi:ribosome-associated protein